MDFKLENLMPLLVVLPLFAGIGALLLPPQRRGVCGLVCAASLVTFVLSLVLACNFDFSQSAEFQFNAWLPWVESFGLSFRFGMDSISLWLVLLTTFLMPLVVLGSYSAVTHRVREFYAWLLILEAANGSSMLCHLRVGNDGKMRALVHILSRRAGSVVMPTWGP